MGRLPLQAFVSIPVRTSHDTKRILKEQQAWFEFTERRSETLATPPQPPVYCAEPFRQSTTLQPEPEVEHHSESPQCVPDSQAETILEESGSSMQADQHVFDYRSTQSQTTSQTSSMTSGTKSSLAKIHTDTIIVVDTSQPSNSESFTSSQHSRSSYAPSDVSSRILLPARKRRRLEREHNSIVRSSSPLTAASDLDRPRRLRDRPMVPPNYQEMSSQLSDRFFESSQQMEMDDMNYLLVMNGESAICDPPTSQAALLTSPVQSANPVRYEHECMGCQKRLSLRETRMTKTQHLIQTSPIAEPLTILSSMTSLVFLTIGHQGRLEPEQCSRPRHGYAIQYHKTLVRVSGIGTCNCSSMLLREAGTKELKKC